jgi:hypothetical protein
VKKLSTAEKRRIRLLIVSHLQHCTTILRESAPYSLERAQRSLKDGEDLFLLHKQSLPQRSRDAIWNHIYELKKRLT